MIMIVDIAITVLLLASMYVLLFRTDPVQFPKELEEDLRKKHKEDPHENDGNLV